MKKMPSTLGTYGRIEWKILNEGTKLTHVEKDVLQDLLIENYTEWVTRIGDERLMQEASDKGILS